MTDPYIQINGTKIEFGGNIDGWIATGTFTYASATTIAVASGAESIYQKGDKLRLKQGAGYKYFYITAVVDTGIAVMGGTNFTVANSAITDMAYSHIENPLGFPQWFNWTSNPTGFSPVSVNICKFTVVGNICFVNIDVEGTSNSTTKTIDLPIIVGAGLPIYYQIGQILDNAAWGTVPGIIEISGGALLAVNVYKNNASQAWTASGACRYYFITQYQI